MQEELVKLFTPKVQRIAKAFAAKGFELRVVGGAVRDVCLGRAPNDVDLATDCPENDVSLTCEAAGLKARPIYCGVEKTEVTVWHIYCDGSSPPYDLAHLKPSKEHAGDCWIQDAARRDFTINAMSTNMSGILFDYFGGRKHVQESRIDWIGSISDRILEAPARLIRYFRFHGEALNNFGMEHLVCKPTDTVHDPEVFAEMQKHVHHINLVAPESQRELLFQVILKSGQFAVKPELHGMYEIGLLKLLLPDGVTVDFDEADLVRRRQEHWKDKHNVKVSPLLTMAALLRWDKAELSATAKRWRCSSESLNFCDILCETRCRALPTLRDSWCRLWAVDGFKWRRNTGESMEEEVLKGREQLQQLLLVHDQVDELDEVQGVPVPKLPVLFSDMQKYMVQRVGQGLQGLDAVNAMKELRYCFLDSGCDVSAEQLLERWYATSIFRNQAESIFGTCDELSIAIQRCNSRFSRPTKHR